MSDFPERLRLRDTKLFDDLGGAGQRIFTTAGQGYEKQEYVRADVHDAEIERLQKDAERLQKEIEQWRTTGQNLLEQMLDEIRRGDRFAEALEEIASLPDVRSDEAALIARKALA